MQIPAADPNAIDVVAAQPQPALGQDAEHRQESFNMASMDGDGEDDTDTPQEA
jgi:hypothetical protein